MNEATRSCPSIYSAEYQRIVDKVNCARNTVEYQKACQELLIFVDLHVDGIRQAYEKRGEFQPFQAGTMVYCKVEDHLVRCGRTYGHRLTEISGHPAKLEYYVQLFFDGAREDQQLAQWINADNVFANAEEAFK